MDETMPLNLSIQPLPFHHINRNISTYMEESDADNNMNDNNNNNNKEEGKGDSSSIIFHFLPREQLDIFSLASNGQKTKRNKTKKSNHLIHNNDSADTVVQNATFTFYRMNKSDDNSINERMSYINGSDRKQTVRSLANSTSNSKSDGYLSQLASTSTTSTAIVSCENSNNDKHNTIINLKRSFTSSSSNSGSLVLNNEYQSVRRRVDATEV